LGLQLIPNPEEEESEESADDSATNGEEVASTDTPWLTMAKLMSEYTIGEARLGTGPDPAAYNSPMFAQRAFSRDMQEFTPVRAYKAQDYRVDYLFVAWMTDQKDGAVPPLEEIHDEVVAAWK